MEKPGKVVAKIRGKKDSKQVTWAEIMAPILAAHKEVKLTTPNPVLAERARRRR